jgi:hypothetical protein
MTNPTGTGTGQPGDDQGQGQGQGPGQGQGQGQGQPSPKDMPGAGQQQGQQQGQQEPPDTDDPKELNRQLKHWKEMARKNETRATDNLHKASEYDKLLDANKSDLQKAQDNESRANARAADAEANTARLLAAASHELHPDLVDFLGSGKPSEIDERADILARVINEQVEKRIQALRNGGQPNGQQPTSPGNGRPAESLRPGAAPAANNAGRASDVNSAFRQMLNQARGQ